MKKHSCRGRHAPTARTQPHTLPTVPLRLVFIYQQSAGAGDVTAAKRHIVEIEVVELQHVVVVGHQAGDVSGAEVPSLNLLQATPRLSAQGQKGHAKVTRQDICNGHGCEEERLTAHRN